MQSLTAFNSDGFSVGTRLGVNDADETFVAWQWLESATAGFDMVTYTGNETNRTISHSLGVVPELIIVKLISGADSWTVYHADNYTTPATDALTLDSTAATAEASTFWNDTAPTSSVFSVGTGGRTNTDGGTLIAYLWASVEGFSKIGYYRGDGSADGPFAWCGFRPAMIFLKRINAVEGWAIHDTQRSPYNVVVARLEPNATDAEATNLTALDFLSNGFKIRGTDTLWNDDGSRYCFAAWADTPFKTAPAR